MAIAARVIGDAAFAAVVARLDMAAERRGPANLDRAHDAPLDAAKPPRLVAPIGVAMAAENLRRLEGGRRHWSLVNPAA